MGNFEFLKNADNNVYKIINEAEKLYRDEYFEQCIVQTRKFAENVCKNVLGQRRTTENTFDEMLSTLSDISKGSGVEKEFIDDMYYLKQKGNLSAHSNNVYNDGKEALECLKRAFELGINYFIKKKGKDKNVLNLHYDINLLMTDKKDKNLSEKYQEIKDEQINEILERAGAEKKKTQDKKSNVVKFPSTKEDVKKLKELKKSSKKKKDSKKEEVKETKENKEKEQKAGLKENVYSFIVTLILFCMIGGVFLFIMPDWR